MDFDTIEINLVLFKVNTAILHSHLYILEPEKETMISQTVV